MFDLKTYLDSRRMDFETFVTSMDFPVMGSGRLLSAMKYSLISGGKRLRPVLCMAAAEAVGGSHDRCMNTATAIEMIHTYSLIHDDLPAMDNDALRRGQPTCHIQFDEATAILAGDALLTLAFQLLSSPLKKDTDDPSVRLKIIEMVAEAAGFQGMIEGQMRDMESEGKQIPQDKLENLHSLKTGALIKASLLTGALLCGAGETELNAIEKYGEYIGLAFQVADDILNVTGDSEIMGKSTGTDSQLNKATYPSLLGLQASIDYGRELIRLSLKELECFDEKADPLRAIATYIIERNR
jgi:geranylgeranyl diphosphate synthase type II